MASHTVSYISKTLLSILFVAGLVLKPNLIYAQEPTEEEYKALTDIQGEKDVNKKSEMILSFLKDKPKSAYRPNVVNEYQKIMVDWGKEKKFSQLISLGEKYLDVVHNDDWTVRNLAGAYAETNNSKGFATFGEKVYAEKPSAALALQIAKAYQKMGNDAKYMQWREKVLAEDPDNIEILTDMIKRYQASNNTAQALKYAGMALKALPTAKKPPEVSEREWQEITNAGYGIAYGVIGGDAYQQRKYAEAITNLTSAIKYYKRNDAFYYYLGNAYWQLNKLEPAMLNFAKAYILKGSTAAAAKQSLDKLWASGHRNSLAGEERVIEKAQMDLK